MTTRKKTALWLMIGPTAALVITFIGYALVNALFNSGGSAVINILLFIVGVISTLAWLPGMIVGIVLLSTKK